MSRKSLNDSKQAYSALNVLGAIVGALENGTTRGFEKTAQSIIKLCNKEAKKQLLKMDKADAELGYPFK